MKSGKTLVLGASVHTWRYSNEAIRLLRHYKHDVIAVGKDEGAVAGVEILHEFPEGEEIDTVTMYLNAGNQRVYHDKIIAAKPRRIIFNPGAENPELAQLAHRNGIETEEACTLVMLRTGNY